MYLTTEIESVDEVVTSRVVSIIERLKLTMRKTDEDLIEPGETSEEEEFSALFQMQFQSIHPLNKNR